ncbi:hypothetical protein DSCO28_27270 [Desulfosarcina ovata subsp. sediminis]|uniref:Uncharacterized protein n=1 Tax=Desulfosarcina ovata subsp. sediminis TaxID=885957 RepID=A0A5K7ZMB2_9BACT|nr:DUF3466 family protein [Desulfosarcina ovata]BBO82161.1 hypothetical protein DSCO28_27270 [Desulfosarcina ovata subsp. sediminis]
MILCSREHKSGTSFTASAAVAVYSDDDTIAVIGNSATEDGEKRAFYWQDDTFVDLPPMYYTIDFEIVDDDGNETTYEGHVVKNNSEAIAMNGTYILVNLEDEDGTHAYYWDKQSYTTIKVYDEKYEDYDDVDGDSDDDNDDDDDDVDAEPDSVEISVPDYQMIGNETSDDSEAVAINDANQTIVNVGDGDRVIVYDIDNANSETLEPLSGADDIYAVAINDDGNIAGTSGDDAFFWKNGNMTLCGNLCDDQADGVSVATAINNDNQVVGYATNDDGDYHAFVWQYEDGEAVITDLDTLGGDSSYAVAINDNGVVIGYSETGETYETGSKTYNIYHACAWYDGGIYDLGVVESDDADFIFSVGVAINNSDRITGNSYTINDFTRGFVIDAIFP